MSSRLVDSEGQHALHERPPLHGIRVVDFGVYLAGPLVGRILCDAGAQVTAVLPPDGPLWKHEVNNALARGKDVIHLDLKSSAGKAVAMDMISNADVVIENFSPGVMERLGFSAAKVASLNPRCVYLSLPGFASQDPQFADLQAYEAVIMAAAGVYADMGFNRQLMGINPSYSPLPLASTYGSVMGAIAAVLALIGRETTGNGDIIEVPLAGALCDALIYNCANIPAPERYLSMREVEIERRRDLGLQMDCNYNQIKELLDPFYHTYICQDGRPFYLVAPCHEIHQRRTLKALGVWDEMVAQSLPIDRNVWANADDWGEGINCILGTYPITDPDWILRLKNAMKAAFKKRPAAEWERIFMARKIPAGMIRTTQEWINSEHALASGLVQQRKWTSDGPIVKEAGPVAWLKPTTVPTSEASRAAGIAIAKRAAERASCKGFALESGAPWLSGTRVVDFSNVIAGPCIGGMLARYGATVIKVDPEKPMYDALVAVCFAVPVNRGKVSLLANLKRASAADILRRLVQWADVVVYNGVGDQLHCLGIDEASLKEINPHVILTHFDAYGGPGTGPFNGSIAYDDVLQAVTGIMERFGGGLDTPEEHAHLGTIDVVSGFSGTLSTCMALFKRLRTGQADTARTSLAANAMHIQAPFMYDYVGRSPFSEPRGPEVRGEHALYRWYQTKDSHVFVAAPQQEPALLAACAALAKSGIGGAKSLALVPEATRAASLEDALRFRSTDAALELFRSAGMTAVPLSTLTELRQRNDSQVTSFCRCANTKTFHFHTVSNHPIGFDVTMFSPCSVLSERVKIGVPSVAPKYGQHSRMVLGKVLGYSDVEITEFIKQGVVGDEWSDQYVPTGNPWATPKVRETYDTYMQMVSKL